MIYLTLAVLNATIGWFFIERGIKNKGKTKFLKEGGDLYMGWVVLSTLLISTGAL